MHPDKVGAVSSSSDLPPSSDPLGEILHLLRLNGVLYCRAELTAPWGIELPELEGCMMIQIVTAGHCWLEIEGDDPRLLRHGSLALMPHGTGHSVRSSPRAEIKPLSDIPVENVSDRYEIMRYGGGGDLTRITYCGVRFDHVAAQRLIELLPRVLQVDTWDQEDSWLHSTV
ncbi:MAG: cupin domain-containing protein, partial [Chloroflexi bacterium]|nr:cupin domain-containing protein [Chloroflexota bacterium]